MSRFIRPVLITALALAPLGAAQAQDWRGTPVYGQISLDHGFVPDPHTVEITAGGVRDASNLPGDNCSGSIGQNPDFVLRYTAGEAPLFIRAQSEADTTIAVRGPKGGWSCNDDTNGLNPEVGYLTPQSGNYHIWVGTFGGATAPATIEISELAADSYANSGSLDMTAEPAFGRADLVANFQPDPHQVDIVAGGSISISSVSDQCPGSVASAPDYRVNYDGNGSMRLTFTFVSDEDTVLLINDPQGYWYCDDDSGGDLDPRLPFDRAASGIYDIWVGTIGGQMAHGTLSVTEIR